MSSDLTYVSEEEVQSLLKWSELFPAIEQVFADVSRRSAEVDSLIIQPARILMPIPHKSAALLAMPGLSGRKNVLACKIVTSFVNNPRAYNLPSIMANIMLLDSETGRLKAVLAGDTITEWRTACASAVAAKHLKSIDPEKCELSVLGSGKQGRIHIIAFRELFGIKRINLWNRTHANGLRLSKELKDKYGIEVRVFSNVRECTRDADVIVTATYASEPILRCEDVKSNVLICAVGAGVTHHSELHRDIYEKSAIYTDSLVNANAELKGLLQEGFHIRGEIGELINKTKEWDGNGIAIFHSLGMAVEDAVAAELVWEAMKRDETPARNISVEK